MQELDRYNFLKQVARSSYAYYKDNLKEVTFVFPNRRSGLFFQRYLGEVIEKPIFSPRIVTITQLFEELSQLTPADSLSLLLQLYTIYCKHTKSTETFDVFMFWGQMLLSDFEDICKYDVDAHLLFANLEDIKELDELFDYLTEEQKETIRRFWSEFSAKDADSMNRGVFKSVWGHLADIMQEFNEQLLRNRDAYPGLIQLEAVRKLESGDLDDKLQEQHVVFVGFNALTQCEHRLFSYYKKRAQTLFFWDYKGGFLSDEGNLASKFKEVNLRDFPQTLRLDAACSQGRFYLVGVPSLVGQAQYVRKAIGDVLPDGVDWMEMAVVLPDESLLMPVLQALPENVSHVNVTMGYPLSVTDVLGFLELLFELRRKKRVVKQQPVYYYRIVLALLRHKYLIGVIDQDMEDVCRRIISENRVYVPQDMLVKGDGLLSQIFEWKDDVTDLQYLTSVWNALRYYIAEQPLLSEEKKYVDQACVVCQRLMDVLSKYAQVSLRRETIFAVLLQYMRAVTIPFQGEPLNGLQVMGLLETRALDFRKVVILSANEGTLPKTQTSNSFIPYNLRKGYGLPTFEEHDAIMAYNFYRLITNAEEVHLVYDNRTNKEQTQEVSRYVWQLKYQYEVDMQESLVLPEVKMTEGQNFSLTDSEFIQEKLAAYCYPVEKGGKALSASALNVFLKCSAQFYFSNLCGLSSLEEVKENIEADMFGTLYHAVMEKLYEPYSGKEVTGTVVMKLKEMVECQLKEVYARNMLNIASGEFPKEIAGEDNLVLQVLREYLLKQLDNDLKDTPFHYIAPEQSLSATCAIDGGKRCVNLKGYVDRIDRKEDEIRIIDYKTGEVGSLQFEEVKDLFDASLKDKRSDYALQTMLYAWLYLRNNTPQEGMRIVPYIASLRSFYSDEPLKGLIREEGRTKIPVDDYVPLNDEFEQALRDFLENTLFSKDVKFEQTQDSKTCAYCAFVELCGRKTKKDG